MFIATGEQHDSFEPQRRSAFNWARTACGETPPFVVGQIAAIARVRDLTLVTFNDGDFRRFEGLRVLTW